MSHTLTDPIDTDELRRAPVSDTVIYNDAFQMADDLEGWFPSHNMTRYADMMRDLASECRHQRADLSALRAREAETGRLHDLRSQHAAWSQQQFGDVSAIGPAKHLSKEALEVAAEPHDAIEHADCWMLLWDMQRRAGITDAQLANAIQQKLAINMARQWPAPKEGEAREHTRAALSQPDSGEGA